MWKSQTTQRGSTSRSFGFVKHLFSYPAESFLSFLPWTFGFLPLIFIKGLRTGAKQLFANDLFLFSFIMIAVNFPLYWLLPGARVRYVLPIGPFLAIILAHMCEWYKYESENDPRIKVFFNKFLNTLLWTVSLCALLIIPAALFVKADLSSHLVFLISALIIFVLFLWFKRNTLRFAGIPVVVAVLTGFFVLTYSVMQAQLHEKKPDNPLKIARAINDILPKDNGVVYEIGYDIFLEITCYINKEVIQLDSFDQVKQIEKQKNVYFIFDSAHLRKATRSAGIDPLETTGWEKVYASPYRNGKKELVVGHIGADSTQ